MVYNYLGCMNSYIFIPHSPQYIKFLCRMGSGHPSTNVQLPERFTLYLVWRRVSGGGLVDSEVYHVTGPVCGVWALFSSVPLCN